MAARNRRIQEKKSNYSLKFFQAVPSCSTIGAAWHKPLPSAGLQPGRDPKSRRRLSLPPFFSQMIYLAKKLLVTMRVADFALLCLVISNLSLNRNKTDQEAGTRLWPLCLDWKSKAIRLVSSVIRHVHRRVAHGVGGAFKARLRTGFIFYLAVSRNFGSRCLKNHQRSQLNPAGFRQDFLFGEANEWSSCLSRSTPEQPKG